MKKYKFLVILMDGTTYLQHANNIYECMELLEINKGVNEKNIFQITKITKD